MKQNLIFIVILLVTLSMVNAIPYYQFDKRATTFEQCPTGSQFPITVSIQPDPPVLGQDCTFTVTGTIDSGINPGTTLLISLVDGANKVLNQATIIDICTAGATCPTTSFSITRTITIDAGLPATYSIVIAVTDENKTMLSCALGTITG
ncbi:unnamed protein product [Rhizophagus irregularis]|uniref:Phosphatidylglycerol/phosphatidylinositol transfer protein n=1 Tax=Rhizophagus irregularis TaxID=588596 RepID=A0A2N1MQS6_9GLOM|nr:hypothetical protein RhiirC2_757443 [Rhizophagus irregularis]CAB4394653.1 unnamed protein product [Rhizophagus irregularis]